MPLVGAKSVTGDRRSRADLEEERLELEEETSCLRLSAAHAQQRLPIVVEELTLVEAQARDEASLTEKAEAARLELHTELAGIVNNAKSERVVDKYCGRAVWSPEIQPHCDKEEIDELIREIELCERDVEELQNVSDSHPQRALVEAEHFSSELRFEVNELRDILHAVEDDGRRLAEEHAQAELEVEPLQDWIEHLSSQLRLARTENSELTVSLTVAAEHRNELERDESEAQPLKSSGIDAAIVCWLQDRERQGVRRRALLEEELASDRQRRQQLISEAGRLRSEAVAEERRRAARVATGVTFGTGGRFHPPSLFHPPSKLRTKGPAENSRPQAQVREQAQFGQQPATFYTPGGLHPPGNTSIAELYGGTEARESATALVSPTLDVVVRRRVSKRSPKSSADSGSDDPDYWAQLGETT